MNSVYPHNDCSYLSNYILSNEKDLEKVTMYL